MPHGSSVIAGFVDAFVSQKALAEKAIAQLSDEELRRAPSGETNSAAAIMKHVSGNLRSRFTDFLYADGEKAWRDRDAEFEDTFQSREEIMQTWEAGWGVLLVCLNGLGAEHIDWEVTIRGKAHTVPHALGRALAHVGYHTGQIVLTARLLHAGEWRTITVPRGGSKAFNKAKGFDPVGEADGHGREP